MLVLWVVPSCVYPELLAYCTPWLQAAAKPRSSYATSNQTSKVKSIREITEESLELEPLCNEVVMFSKSPISAVSISSPLGLPLVLCAD